MKGVFIYYHKMEIKNLTGIDKKVLSQIEVFNSVGLECKLITLDSGLMDTDNSTLIDKVKSRLPFSNLHPKWKYNNEYDDLDFIYFRRPLFFTAYAIQVLKKIKLRNPNIKIILEIPTYPYDKELQMTWKYYPFSLKDKYNRRKLKGLVNRIAYISGNENKEIFGIPALRLFNGIDLNKIKPKKVTNNDIIDLCGVSMFAKWHGYERLLYGLSIYYKNDGTRNIVLHLVGEGCELNSYQKIVKEEKLEKHVVFYGMKTGQELDSIYDKMDIGLDVFGMYKKNLSVAYSLKSREYLAKGLPIISGCAVDLFKEVEGFKYFHEFENNGDPIDINQIIMIYDEIYYGAETREEVINNIRMFAVQTCDIKDAMKNILDYLIIE